MSEKTEKARMLGRRFSRPVDFETSLVNNKWVMSVRFGENYYETDPYENKECALSEAKGYIDGHIANLKDLSSTFAREIERLEQERNK